MIQEVISSDISVAGEMQFEAVQGDLEVAVDGPGVAGIDFINAVGSKWFFPGDNILLQKMWCNIPYGFGQGTGRLLLGPRWSFDGGGTAAISEFGGLSGTESYLALPGVCCPLEFPGNGLFLRAPTSEENVRFKFALFSLALNASMVNLADILDGATVKVQFHCLIQHSKPMQPGAA